MHWREHKLTHKQAGEAVAVQVDPGLRRKVKKMLASKQTFGKKGGFSPLGWFVFKGDLDTCAALLACGAKVN